jgi:hypothetical protein
LTILLKQGADRDDVDRILGQPRRHHRHAVGRETELRLADRDDRDRILAGAAIDDLVVDALFLEEALGLRDHQRRVLAVAQPAELRHRTHLLGKRVERDEARAPKTQI